ncbi:Protein of unknown function [Tenacibaculum sp. MAR_2009_124]|uniref:DUF2851 family protein n=1 Tax=Tenacibaculum sp. MAR_2009_124 TaxID=1250059 RepID=UPI0008988085|nr:DUF2851 family protein [Tenacibaculum sp. MAR_2009_124]SEB73048.1 Protein of unknown function [Tenacibaculum sp. MAR_2009_124]
MKEDLLHFLWCQKLIYTHKLTTISQERIKIVKTGIWNKNTGPDFLNAHILFNDQLWIGNVEMHLKSSDWYVHQHEFDENYDAVILHVVWEHDVGVFMKNEKLLPTLVLKDFVKPNVLRSYKRLMFKGNNWIFCEKQLVSVDSFLLGNWLERLYFERLERKAMVIHELLSLTNNDYEAVLFFLMAKTFGSKVNGEVFLKLARSFPYHVLRKLRFNKTQLSALLFGQAGFLEDEMEGAYFKELKDEYTYMKHKFKLKGLKKREFQFFRMRPSNFPTIRIAQLAALILKYPDLFSRIIKVNELHKFYELFSVQVDEFWKEHYTFETSSKKSNKFTTKSMINLLVINVIVPMKFVFMKNSGEFNSEEVLTVLKRMGPEQNNIISKFSENQLVSTNALHSQALIELKTSYCDRARCLDCVIGCYLLKK